MTFKTEYEIEYTDLLNKCRRGESPTHTPFSSAMSRSEWGVIGMQDELRVKYGYAILTGAAIERLKAWGPFIEVGAGTGYWAYELKKHEVDIIATDVSVGAMNPYHLTKSWTEVLQLSAIEAIEKYPERSLLSVWPSYNDAWTGEMLKSYKGRYFVYCGEDSYGCTGDEFFHQQLNDEKVWRHRETIGILQWPGLHDRIFVFERVHD